MGRGEKAKPATRNPLLSCGDTQKAFEVTASDFEEVGGGEAEGAEEALRVAGEVER